MMDGRRRSRTLGCGFQRILRGLCLCGGHLQKRVEGGFPVLPLPKPGSVREGAVVGPVEHDVLPVRTASCFR